MATEDEARQVVSACAGHLTTLPNVVGVGVVPSEGAAAEAAVAVYVRTKVPKEALRPEEIVPKSLSCLVDDGQSLHAPTQVIEVGDIKF